MSGWTSFTTFNYRDYGITDDSTFLEWTARLGLRFSTKWDVGVGWRGYERDLDDRKLVNDFKRDGWTVTTRDHEPSAHFENTVAVTTDGAEVLTGER